MSSPEVIGLHLADKHLKKIAKGGAVQLSHPMLHESIESKNVKSALQHQIGNDVMDYAHEKAYQHMTSGAGKRKVKAGGKIHIPKGLRDFGNGFVKGLKIVAHNPIAQGVATNLITGALMGGAGKPKRFTKGSAEAKAHMAKIRGMRKGSSLFPAGV